MRVGFLVHAALILGCGQVGEATRGSRIPTFNFPASISSPTLAEKRVSQFSKRAEHDLGGLVDKHVVATLKAGNESSLNLTERIAKDPNKAAAGVLTRLKSNPREEKAVREAYEFPDLIANRIRTLNTSDARRTNKELMKYCVTGLAIMKVRKPYKGSGYLVQSLRDNEVAAALALNENLIAKAVSMQSLAENKDKDDWNYGNVIHYSNMDLAEIALRENNLNEASRRLVAAGASPGSPQLESFGPSFPLAKKLLDAGRRGAVIQYLRGISKFWNKEEVETWITALKSGLEPTDRNWKSGIRE